MTEDQAPTLRDYLRVLRAHRLALFLVPIVAIAAAVLYSLVQTPSYEASASLSFKDESQDLGVLGTPAASNQDPAKFAAGKAETIESPRVVAAVRRALGGRITTGALKAAVQKQVEPNSDLVVVTAKAATARMAARIANEFARQTSAVVTASERARYRAAAKALQAQFSAAQRKGDRATSLALADRTSRLVSLSTIARPVEITDIAETPGAPSSPNLVANVAFAALLGLVLAALLAFARDALGRKMRSPDAINQQLGMPLLGLVRREAMGQSIHSSNGGVLEASDYEGFQIIRSNLDFLQIDDPLRSVLVASAVSEEGKTTVAASLAAAWATSGKRTLLIECDLRRPALAGRLGLRAQPGLSDLLAQTEDLSAVRQQVEVGDGQLGNGDSVAPSGSLFCITAGTPTTQPAELLASERFRRFMGEVTRDYDRVVLDTSPLLPVVDTLELVPQVDGILLCVRITRTTTDQLRAAQAALGRLPSRPAGFVVTDVRKAEWGQYGYPAYGYAAAGRTIVAP